MGFTGLDDIIRKTTVDGNFFRAEWNKSALPTTNQVSGEWYCLHQGAGTPGAGTIFGTGTNLAFQPLTDSTPGVGGIPHGGDVFPRTKHVLSASVTNVALATQPCVFMLVDILGFYPITSVTTTGDQILDNTLPFPARHENGREVRAYVTPSTVMGAAVPTFHWDFIDQDGLSGENVAPLPTGKTASPKGHISYSGVAGTGKFGPFMTGEGGDPARRGIGLRQIDTFGLSLSYISGVLNIVVCRPLLTIPMTNNILTAERNFVTQFPSLPRVYDGSVLSWLMWSAGATPVNTNFFGHINFGWG